MVMTPVMSSTALVLHNLGLATGFGGTLFGKIGLDPGARVLESKEDRGKIVNAAWSRYGVANMLGLGISAITWFIGRTRYTGREVDRTARKLVIFKDILVGTSLVTQVGSLVAGSLLHRQAPQGAVPIESGLKPSPETPERAVRLQRVTNTLGIVNMFSVAGVIALTSVLNFKAGVSHKWGLAIRRAP